MNNEWTSDWVNEWMYDSHPVSSAVLSVGVSPARAHGILNRSLAKQDDARPGARIQDEVPSGELCVLKLLQEGKTCSVRQEKLWCANNMSMYISKRGDCKLFFFFWQRGWSVLGNAKEFVIYKHVPDILTIRNFSEMKCQECAWEQQMPFTRRPIAGLLTRCLSPSGVPSAALTLQLQGPSPTFSHYLSSTYQPCAVWYIWPLPWINTEEADL